MQDDQDVQAQTQPEREPVPVVFLPSALLPADISYGRLVTELEGEIKPLLKDLEVYSDVETPPLSYRLEMEVEGIVDATEEAGFDSFARSLRDLWRGAHVEEDSVQSAED